MKPLKAAAMAQINTETNRNSKANRVAKVSLRVAVIDNIVRTTTKLRTILSSRHFQ